MLLYFIFNQDHNNNQNYERSVGSLNQNVIISEDKSLHHAACIGLGLASFIQMISLPTVIHDILINPLF